MDVFRFCAALGPVGIYLLLLGVVGLSQRTRLVSGGRDTVGLALAVSGLILVGPMELIVSFEAIHCFGVYIWLLLPGLYALCVVLWILMMRPRLVLYNTTVDKLRPILADVVTSLDPEARWAGDCLSLPGLGVQFYIDGVSMFRCVSLVSAGARQSQQGWRKLKKSLAAALVHERISRSPRGLLLLFAGFLCFSLMSFLIIRDPLTMYRSLDNVVYTVLQIIGLIK